MSLDDKDQEEPIEVFGAEEEESTSLAVYDPDIDDPKAISVNPKLDAFLYKWDRCIPLDRRCFGPKILFAGCDSNEFRDGLYRIGVRHILISYYYSRGWLKKRTVPEIAEDLGRFDFVFLDSGAFTFMQMINDGKEMKLDIKEYYAEYMTELARFGHLFSGCAEVDVHDRFTQYEMEEYKDKLLDKNVPIVPVIQGQRVEVLKEMKWFEKFPYIALGSMMVGSDKHVMDINAIIKYGQECGNVFHAFGATAADTIIRGKYYSSDSTTWVGGSRFGNTMIFQNGRIRYYDNKHKDVRKRFKQRFEESGLIWKDIEDDKRKEVDIMNALAWKQWGDSIRFNVQNSYWLSAEEKDLSISLKSKAFNTEGLIDRKTSLARAEARRLTRVDDAAQDDRVHEFLYCDTCFLTGRCPRYKAGEVCGYDINVRIETKLDIQKALQNVLEVEYGRVMTGVLFEKMQGGVIDKNLSGEMKDFMTMVQQVRAIFEPRGEQITIQASSPTSGSVGKMLAAVFSPGNSGSGAMSPTQRAAKVIDAESFEEKK